MSISTIPESNIHFLFNPGFREIKSEAIAVGILRAVHETSQVTQIGTTFRDIRAYLERTFGFDLADTESTRRLLYRELNVLLADKLIERQFNDVGQANLRISPQAARELRLLEVYQCTPDGKARILQLDKYVRQIGDGSYQEFCQLLVRLLAKAGLVDAWNDGEGQPASPTAWLEEVYAQINPDEPPDRLNLQQDFERYLTAVKPAVVERILRPLRHQIGAPAEETPTVNFRDHFHLGSPADDAHAHLRRSFDNALRRVCKIISTDDVGDAGYIEERLYADTYSALLREVWPYDKEVQEWLSEDLPCISIYPDTNVIIAALSPSDPKHDICRRILEFLISNRVRVFWDSLTEREFMGHLEAIRKLIALLEAWDLKDIFEILEVTRAPSLVHSYFTGGWRSWESFKQDVLRRYEILKKNSLQVEIDLNDIPRLHQEMDECASEVQALIEEHGFTRDNNAMRIKHDARALAMVIALRRLRPAQLLRPECSERDRALVSPFWFLSLDHRLHSLQEDIDRAGLDPSGEPIFLLFRTVFLFLEPYAVAQALRKIHNRPQTEKLGTLDTSNRDLFDRVWHAALEKKRDSISSYIAAYNLEMYAELEKDDRSASVL